MEIDKNILERGLCNKNDCIRISFQEPSFYTNVRPDKKKYILISFRLKQDICIMYINYVSNKSMINYNNIKTVL